MLHTILGVIDFLGLGLALFCAFMASMLVLRTEKELDTAAKFLLGNVLILVIANLATLNGFFGGIISDNAGRIIFHASRILALIFLAFSLYYFLKITDKK